MWAREDGHDEMVGQESSHSRYEGGRAGGMDTVAFLVGGCGVVNVPTSQEFPGPIKALRVIDAQNGQALVDAEATLTVWPQEN
jgi:hypothetical protein